MTIKSPDIANGTGCRVSLFVSGCTFMCKDCFNPEAWPFDAGYEFTDDIIKYIILLLKQEYISGLTILGGEPLHQKNAAGVKKLIKAVRGDYIASKKSIWVFSGFTFEELEEIAKENKDYKYILEHIDVLVDGRFKIDEKDISLKFKGSRNQRLIDIPATMRGDKIVLLNI